MAERYLPIENHGIIGDLNSTALVGLNGTIDFFCYPDFDSPTVFASLLDADKGGYFSLSPVMQGHKQRQLYLPDTNVLVTRFLSSDGIIEVTDCMPVRQNGPQPAPGKQIIRMVKAVKGEMDIVMRCAPRFDYGLGSHMLTQSGSCVTITPGSDVQPVMRLYSEQAMRVEGSDIHSRFTLNTGQTAHFMLVWAEDVAPESTEDIERILQDTIHFWREWIAQSNYYGRWREMVNRSTLTLKLLISHKNGAMVAAPTFSLPEAIGAARNWDYRYCWIRDSAFTIYAMMRLGFRGEAIDYLGWIEKRFKESKDSGQLHLMYRINGQTDIEEKTLDHFEGYKGSGPVRIGNAASTQNQLDIYGELLDSVYLANRYVQGLSHDSWVALSKTVDYVCDHWRDPDHGIWEIRGEKQHFLHSRLMCWVAVDRALKLALSDSLPAPIPHWGETRTAIYHSIFADFWDEELQSFVQYAGGKTVDASTLMMPMVKFIAPTDPRWLSTLDLIGKRLGTDALIRRYDADGMDFEGIDKSTEGSFTMCSFWYVECLARAGKINEARLLFEKMLAYANHVGLYAEELGTDGSHLGNFPQAFTHLALISAAYALNLKLDNDTHHAWRF